MPAGGYRVTLTVDGKEYTQALVVENDPKADPKAIISFEFSRPGKKQDDDDEEMELKEIVPFIPKAKD